MGRLLSRHVRISASWLSPAPNGWCRAVASVDQSGRQFCRSTGCRSRSPSLGSEGWTQIAATHLTPVRVRVGFARPKSPDEQVAAARSSNPLFNLRDVTLPAETVGESGHAGHALGVLNGSSLGIGRLSDCTAAGLIRGVEAVPQSAYMGCAARRIVWPERAARRSCRARRAARCASSTSAQPHPAGHVGKRV